MLDAVDFKDAMHSEVLSVSTLQPGERGTALHLLNSARELKEWQITQGIPSDIEVGRWVGGQNQHLEKQSFYTGSRDGVSIKFLGRGDALGSVHTHPIPAPHSLADVEKFVEEELVSGVISADDKVFFLVRSFTRFDTEQIGILDSYLTNLSIQRRRYMSYFLFKTGLVQLALNFDAYLRFKYIRDYLRITNTSARMLTGRLNEDELTCLF